MHITVQAILKSKQNFSAKQSGEFYRSLTPKKSPKDLLIKGTGKGKHSECMQCCAAHRLFFYQFFFPMCPSSFLGYYLQLASCSCVRMKFEAHRLLSALPWLVLSYVQLFPFFLELFITTPCYLKSKDFPLLLQWTKRLCLYFATLQKHTEQALIAVQY